MKTQSESVNVSKDTRTVHSDIRTNDPNPRTIHDARLRDVLVTHSKSTR
jgi:hypothetical protein